MHSISTQISEILTICGPGRMLVVGSNICALVKDLLCAGIDVHGITISETDILECNHLVQGRIAYFAGKDLSELEISEFDSVVCINYFEYLPEEKVKNAFQILRGICCRDLFLRIDLHGMTYKSKTNGLCSREGLENIAFRNGFRKHPGYYSIVKYEVLGRAEKVISIPLTKIADQVFKDFTLDQLLEERDLHMDMSRETGPRSDAHMVRYSIAARYIRPGDAVLDCACGLGYGTALLAANSYGNRFIGVDISHDAIRYAADNYSSIFGIEYRQGDAENLVFIKNYSIDTFVSFETLEHVQNYEKFLIEIRRVLKPDGRIVVSVPNLWVDETGNDPNPYHHHVFDYEKLCEALIENDFIVEVRYAQTAPGGFKLVNSDYVLTRLPLEYSQNDADAEWLVIVASLNPCLKPEVPYDHPDFDRSKTGKDFHVTDFGEYYNNPWLYRSMVQIGERINDDKALQKLVNHVLSQEIISTADHGAALCVKGYEIYLNSKYSSDEVKLILGKIDDYLLIETDNPHIIRWQISTSYLAGLLSMSIGERDLSISYFSKSVEYDPLDFSPLIATKTTSAWFWMGLLNISNGNIDIAKQNFKRSISTARRALHAPDHNSIGNPDDPLVFGFSELAEIADIASQSTNALHHIDHFKRSPGMFWRSIDKRRFGLINVLASYEKIFHAIDDSMKENSSVNRIINNTLDKLFGIRIFRGRTVKNIRSMINP